MANNNLAAIPELWAREGLLFLTNNAVAAMAVNREYSGELARFGSTVNAYRANARKIRRKTGDDSFTAADAVLTAVPVVMDMWIYDTIVIKDDELSKALPDLTKLHLPAMMGNIMDSLERSILGRIHGYLQQGSPSLRAGKLKGMTKVNSGDYILEAQEILHTNKAPAGVKTAIVHQSAQTLLQGNELFARADARGSANTLLTGEIGQIYNTRVLMSQNVNKINPLTADTQASTTTEPRAAGFAGTHAITDPGTNVTAGEFFVFEENGQPTYATTGGSTTIVLNEALKYAILDDSAATHYLKCVNEATERVAGYQKEMLFTHTSGKNLQVGQLLAFGTSSRHTYTIIEATNASATTTSVLLDRPLDATVASAADAFPGPAGAFNPVFDPNAITLVTRPLYQPASEFGVQSRVFDYKGIGLRVTTQYRADLGGLWVNIDLLAGVSILNTGLMVAMLS